MTDGKVVDVENEAESELDGARRQLRPLAAPSTLRDDLLVGL